VILPHEHLHLPVLRVASHTFCFVFPPSTPCTVEDIAIGVPDRGLPFLGARTFPCSEV
jgi:hypothetical protein